MFRHALALQLNRRIAAASACRTPIASSAFFGLDLALSADSVSARHCNSQQVRHHSKKTKQSSSCERRSQYASLTPELKQVLLQNKPNSHQAMMQLCVLGGGQTEARSNSNNAAAACGGHLATPAIFLSVERDRLLIQAPAGLQRLSTEHSVGLSRVKHILLTRLSARTCAGLVGLGLTIDESRSLANAGAAPPAQQQQQQQQSKQQQQQQQVKAAASGLQPTQMRIVGPAHLVPLMDAATQHCWHQRQDCRPAVRAVTESDPITSASASASASATAASDATQTMTQQTSTTTTHTERFNAFTIQSCVTTRCAMHSHSWDDKQQSVDAATMRDTDEASDAVAPSTSVSYLLQCDIQPGRFNRAQAQALGMKDGVWNSLLKAGLDAECEMRDGSKQWIRSAQVVSPPRDGPAFAVVDVMDRRQLHLLTCAPMFDAYRNHNAAATTPTTDATADAATPSTAQQRAMHLMLHYTPWSIVQTHEYTEWMHTFGTETEHLLLCDLSSSSSQLDEVCLTGASPSPFQSSLLMQRKLALVAPTVFELPSDGKSTSDETNTNDAESATVTDSKPDDQATSVQQAAFESLKQRYNLPRNTRISKFMQRIDLLPQFNMQPESKVHSALTHDTSRTMLREFIQQCKQRTTVNNNDGEHLQPQQSQQQQQNTTVWSKLQTLRWQFTQRAQQFAIASSHQLPTPDECSAAHRLASLQFLQLVPSRSADAIAASQHNARSHFKHPSEFELSLDRAIAKQQQPHLQYEPFPVFAPQTSRLSLLAQLSDHQSPYVSFLGTGSAIPSKYRNVTGIYFSTSGHCTPIADTTATATASDVATPSGGMFLDCGEGTWEQCIRLWGLRGASERLLACRCIFISHMHADHQLGIVSLLSQFAMLRRRHPEHASRRLLVIAPRQMHQWLESYWSTLHECHDDDDETQSQQQQQQVPLAELVELLDSRTCLSCNAHSNPILQRHLIASQMLQSLIVFPVLHAGECYGIALTASIPGTKSSSNEHYKIVYSGDCAPCQSLIDASHNATLLIHESTFESSMRQDAYVKRHSTLEQAVEVARLCSAERLALTHFSQRYPKFQTAVDDSSASATASCDLTSNDSAAAHSIDAQSLHQRVLSERSIPAFDLMTMRMNALHWLPQLTQSHALLFPEEDEQQNAIALEDGESENSNSVKGSSRSQKKQKQKQKTASNSDGSSGNGKRSASNKDESGDVRSSKQRRRDEFAAKQQAASATTACLAPEASADKQMPESLSTSVQAAQAQ